MKIKTVEYYKNLDLADIKYFCEIDLIEKTERWKDIPGYETIYKASDLGRIKSLDRISNNRYGAIKIKSKILVSVIGSSKYYVLGLSKDKKRKTFMVHRIIANSFIEKIPNKPYVNHKDGNKENNLLTNLEWCTSGENQKHAYKNYLQPSRNGINNGRCILTTEKVLEIRNMYSSEKINISSLSRKLNISRSAISSIIHRKTWKHI